MIALGTDYTDSDGRHRVPFVRRDSDGVRRFDLGYFEGGWGSDDCLLCFCDTQLSDTSTIKNDVAPLTLEARVQRLEDWARKLQAYPGMEE